MMKPRDINPALLMEAIQEECGELVAAIAKYSRTVMPGNPTPVTSNEAAQHIIEEIADVQLCIDAYIQAVEIQEDVATIRKQKLDRWIRRLNNDQ